MLESSLLRGCISELWGRGVICLFGEQENNVILFATTYYGGLRVSCSPTTCQAPYSVHNTHMISFKDNRLLKLISYLTIIQTDTPRNEVSCSKSNAVVNDRKIGSLIYVLSLSESYLPRAVA